MALAEPEFSEYEDYQEPQQDMLAVALSGENLAEYVDDLKLAEIGQKAIEGLEIDEDTMKDWEKDAQAGRDLANMIAGKRNKPWPTAADAKFPLVATAAMQFNARAYPAIVDAESPMKVKVYGEDPEGKKAKRSERVRSWAGYRLAITSWEEQIDQLLVTMPLTGAQFRKVYHDPIMGLTTRNCDRVVINNNCSELARMPRISEEFGLYPDEIETNIRSQRFIDFERTTPSPDEDSDAVAQDETAPHYFVEQLCRIDLDEDGYAEPYILTIHRDMQKVVRIEANFRDDDVMRGPDGRVIRIKPREFYVCYRLLPSFDGTFMGIGLGKLLGNLTLQIEGIMNRLMDGGTLASMGGGFIGGGLSLKKSVLRFSPGEWKTIPGAGAELKNNLVPLPVKEPSAVLFQMLGLLIEQGREVANVNETLTGDVGANMQPTTLMALIEQGEKVFTAAYKRIFRALRKEFGLIIKIDAETVDPELWNNFHDGAEQYDPQADLALTEMDISPVADPREVTNMQRMARAQLLREMGANGEVNQQEATRRVLQAGGVTDIGDLLPEPSEEEKAMQAQEMALMKEIEMRLLGAEVEGKEAKVEKLRSEVEENRAEAALDLARAEAQEGRADVSQHLAVLKEMRERRESAERIRLGRMAGAPRYDVGFQQP